MSHANDRQNRAKEQKMRVRIQNRGITARPSTKHFDRWFWTDLTSRGPIHRPRDRS